MLGQRTHDVLESLTNQHDVAAFRDRFVKQRHAALLQSRLQKIFEKLLPQQIQAIAAHSAQYRMQQARGEFPIRHIQKWPGQRQCRHRTAAAPALQKTLRVPGKKSDRADCGEIQQAALNPPEDRLAHRRGSRLIWNFRILAV